MGEDADTVQSLIGVGGFRYLEMLTESLNYYSTCKYIDQYKILTRVILI